MDVPQVSPFTFVLVDVGVATFVPSRYTSYPVTPTLSEDGFQASAKLVCATFKAARLFGTEGACVSFVGGDDVAETVTVFRSSKHVLTAPCTAHAPRMYVPGERLRTTS